MRGYAIRFLSFAVCTFLSTALMAQRVAPPTLSADVIGIPGGSPESFAGKHGGDDMLPYTDDDVELPDGGNAGGVWGFGHFDNDSSGTVDAEEPVFVVVRNDDDESTLFSSLSRPEYGVLHESEDWAEYWSAGLDGPNGAGVVSDTNLTDFEINDWNGWTDESNAYLYNNLGSNQHGLGLPKYRVDYRSTPLEGQDWVFDEIEGFKKSFGFRNTADDPDTEFNERGDCRRWYRARDAIDIRGYLIPFDDVEELANGSLPSLFGWESVDLAGYLRDTIGPLLDHPEVFLWNEGGATPEVLLPPTHLYLFQLSVQMDVANAEGECGGSGDPVCAGEPDPGLCQVQQHAAYWGIPADGSGTYRQSFIASVNFDVSNAAFPDNHPYASEPEDGAALNLWAQDHFWRDNESHFGKYTFEPEGTPALIVQEPLFSRFDGVDDSVLRMQDAGALSAPLPRPLSAAETPTIGVADLAADLDPVEPADGGGAAASTAYQLIFRNGASVVAYANVDDGQTQVFLGGSYDAEDGSASGGDGGEPGPGAFLGEVEGATVADYTRFVLIVNSDGASLRAVESGDYVVNNFSGLTEIGDELASASGDVPHGDGIAQFTIAGDGQTVINTVLILASPGVGPFLRGDCNQDGTVDISDGIQGLGVLFLGTESKGCDAACDVNASGVFDIADATYTFNFLFLGGPQPPSPAYPAAEYSQAATDAAVGCDSYSTGR